MITTVLLLVRYIVQYAPPHRVGTVQGIFLSVNSALVTPIFLLLTAFADQLGFANIMWWTSAMSAVLWVAMLMRVTLHGPMWPEQPDLLPEDERDVAKNFMCASLAEACFVLGMERAELLALAASPDVLEQRELMHRMMREESRARLLQTARARARAAGTPTPPKPRPVAGGAAYEPPLLPAEAPTSTARVSVAVCAFGDGGVRAAAAAARIAPLLTLAFNGSGEGGVEDGEPMLRWLMQPLGGPQDPRRQELMTWHMTAMTHAALGYGTVLEASIGGDARGACLCYPPGTYEDGDIMDPSLDRWAYGVSQCGQAPPYFDRARFGDEVLQRFMGLEEVDLHQLRISRPRSFYVAVLGVHQSARGMGVGKALLGAVSRWADEERCEVYLECAAKNVLVYERCGFKVVWGKTITSKEDRVGVEVFGMARPVGGGASTGPHAQVANKELV